MEEAKSAPAVSTEKKRCTNCGNELEDGQMFCTVCGTKVELEKEQEVVSEQPVLEQKKVQRKRYAHTVEAH